MITSYFIFQFHSWLSMSTVILTIIQSLLNFVQVISITFSWILELTYWSLIYTPHTVFSNRSLRLCYVRYSRTDITFHLYDYSAVSCNSRVISYFSDPYSLHYDPTKLLLDYILLSPRESFLNTSRTRSLRHSRSSTSWTLNLKTSYHPYHWSYQTSSPDWLWTSRIHLFFWSITSETLLLKDAIQLKPSDPVSLFN